MQASDVNTRRIEGGKFENAIVGAELCAHDCDCVWICVACSASNDDVCMDVDWTIARRTRMVFLFDWKWSKQGERR